MPKDIEFILKDFVRHVDNLKAEDDPAGTGFYREFRLLREEQVQNKNEDRFSTEDGKREENLKKNRYKDILPRDDKRVRLTEIEGEKGSDYINASFIEDVKGENGYIAAQGPMPHTLGDFWRMLWQYDTEIVFMLCKLREDFRPKCEKYWADEGESATFGDITVYTESEEEIREDFFRRQLRVEKDGETHTMTQLHYVGWPDHNIPSSPDILRTMIEDVRNFRKRLGIPMVVHCSAGCGRTGTICAIDYAWSLLDKGMIEDEFSMFEIIKSMREQRVSMVQTPDQYEYTHMVMKSLCKEWLAAYSEHDYANVVIGKSPSEEEDDGEELYVNMDFDKDDSQNGDATDTVKKKIVVMPEAPREVEKLVTGSHPATDNLAQVNTQETEKEVKFTPGVPMQKPRVGDTVQTTTTSRPPTMVIVDSHRHTRDVGEYVEVLKTATVSPLRSAAQKTSSPSTSADAQKSTPTSSSGTNISEVQKNTTTSRSSVRSQDAQKKTSTTSYGTSSSDVQKKTSTTSSGEGDFDPHKTVIMVGGTNSTPKIIKSGSVGVSHTKQRAPKPPTAQAVVQPVMVSVQQQQQQQQQQQWQQQQQQQRSREQQTAAKDVKLVEMVKLKTTDRGTSLPDFENVQLSNASSFCAETEQKNSVKKTSGNEEGDEEAPDLPSRNYRPEEIASPPGSPSTTMATHDQEPIIVTTIAKIPTTSPPPSTGTSPAPTIDVKRDRPPQPIPSNQVPPHAQGVQVISARSPGQVRPAGQVVNATPAGQTASAKVAGRHSQAVPGMVSAMVAAYPQQQQHAGASARPASSKPFDTRSVGHPTRPMMVHSHNKSPTMVQRAHPNSAGMMKHQVVPAPGPGQVIVGKTTTSGKIVYMTERPPRVTGARNMPAAWLNQGKNHRGGTYL